jgi:hypothetical protein
MGGITRFSPVSLHEEKCIEISKENYVERGEDRIGIIGLGYVGLPSVIRCCEEGFHVTGFDLECNIMKRSLAICPFFMKILAGYPVACHGDECMPFAEGYKGGAKTPLST